MKIFCTAKETINKMKRMGENICKRSNPQGINIQHTAHAAQYQKDKQPSQKTSRRSK